MKKRKKFKMKYFEISDNNCGCKLGIDGTLIGSWTPIETGARKGIDVGCGCGIIALMIAQRSPEMKITAIDIDEGAISDAKENIERSDFVNRIEIRHGALNDIDSGNSEDKYDLIISNPPFYESGNDPSTSQRMLARHIGSLSPESLIGSACRLLTENGGLGFIGLSANVRKYLEIAARHKMYASKICFVKGHPRVESKRVMLYFKKNTSAEKIQRCDVSHINIKDSHDNFTPEYKELGKEFYLNYNFH